MRKTRYDVVADLAADIASPQVLSRIDKELENIEQQRLELLELRKMAVRRHGPTTSAASDAPQTRRKRQSIHESVESLAQHYRTDQRSPYKKLRFRTRENYDALIKRLLDACGETMLADLKARNIQQLYDKWAEGGKTAMAHSLVTMLRALIHFGATILEDRECERLSVVLHNMRFKVEKSRGESLTERQVSDIISQAHAMGLHSIALAQAFQFDCQLGQKDVIGEWVPINEPGTSEVTAGNQKWLRGLRWSDIDANMILRHTTTRGLKDVKINLRDKPRVLAELDRLGTRPTSGPIIIREADRLPYQAFEFRRQWRRVADAAGVPKHIRNMNSRASAKAA